MPVARTVCLHAPGVLVDLLPLERLACFILRFEVLHVTFKFAHQIGTWCPEPHDQQLFHWNSKDTLSYYRNIDFEQVRVRTSHRNREGDVGDAILAENGNAEKKEKHRQCRRVDQSDF